MRSIADHQQAVAELLSPTLQGLGEETIPLDLARGRVLAEDLLAPVDLPGFDNSQMDGYAAGPPGDLANTYTVLSAIPAGSTETRQLGPGEAAPIMTGAPVPSNAVAVAPVEQARPSAFLNPGESVELPPMEPGNFIRRRGSDIHIGQLALRQGTQLTPPQLGLIAALGLNRVTVLRQLRVGVLSTGDELLPANRESGEASTSPGAIHDANTPMLCAALESAGALAIALPAASDDPDALRESLAETPDLDVLITTGGVSQGAFEVVRQAFPEVEFGPVAMQPGGPQGLGRLTGQRSGEQNSVPALSLLAFPGNPVSAMVSFEVFLRPLLAGGRPILRLPLLEDVRSPETKHQIRRARLRPEGVELLGGPSSHLLHALAESDALVHLPVGLTDAAAGTEVEVWPL